MLSMLLFCGFNGYTKMKKHLCVQTLLCFIHPYSVTVANLLCSSSDNTAVLIGECAKL